MIRARFALVCLLFPLTLTACGGSSDGSIGKLDDPDAGPSFLPVAVPTVSDPPDEGNLFLLAQSFDLADIGYEAVEYFFEGEASAFTNLNALLEDGAWEAEPAEQAAYRTRLVVHRPIDPGRFNGSVLVEWLNVTSGFDTPPSWGSGHVEMYRSGHIWIGVTAQLVGIEGGGRGVAPFYLKAVNPARYGDLIHPGDSFSYDIFSQVTPILRGEANADVLAGVSPDRIVAYGQSQSAGRLVTYINAIQPLYGAYDGFMVHSRGDGAGALAQEPQVPISPPESVRVRTDNNAPVFTIQAETDLTNLGFASARQPDTESFRLWEVTGTSHSDYYGFISGRADSVGEPQFAAVVEVNGVPGFINCPVPSNSGPFHYVFGSAVRALDNWILNGTLPPVAPRMTLTDDQAGFVRDEVGNALGGIRTPHLDAPTALLSGEGNTGGLCFLFGLTTLFPADQLVSLYGSESGYVAAVTDATNAAVAAGFILEDDADDIIAWAPQQWRNQGGM